MIRLRLPVTLTATLTGTLAATALAVTVLSLGSVVPAHGFSEDVCPQPGGGWKNCIATDHLAPTAQDDGERSTVHTDSTYLLAQAVGFTPAQALVIATYDDGADLGKYKARDRDGTLRPHLDSAYYPGVARSNFVGGGIYFHFMAPVTGTGPRLSGSMTAQHAAGAGTPLAHIRGLRPDPTNPFTEPVLANARRWAYGRGPLCVAGLTMRTKRGDYATGRTCYHRPGGGVATMLNSLPLSSKGTGADELDWSTPLGEVVLGAPGDAHPVPASHLAQLVGSRRAPFVRFAIYLHALQDRVSHHRCIDASWSVGPRPLTRPEVFVNPANIAAAGAASEPAPVVPASPTIADPDFITTFADSICDQVHHSQLHALETGTDQSTIAPTNRTLGAALRITLREMRAFVRSPYGHRLLGTVHPVRGHHLVTALIAAESTPDAAQRLDALVAVARARGLEPLPGY